MIHFRLILIVACDNQTPGGTWPPTGWTIIGNVSDAYGTTVYALWKRAANSSEGTATVTNGNQILSAVILTARGGLKTANNGDPISGYGGQYATSTSVDTASVSIPDAGDGSSSTNCLFVAAAAEYSSVGTTATHGSWNSVGVTPTERLDSAYNAGLYGALSLGIATYIDTNGGYGSTTATISNSVPWSVIGIGIFTDPPPATAASGKKSAVASSC